MYSLLLPIAGPHAKEREVHTVRTVAGCIFFFFFLGALMKGCPQETKTARQGISSVLMYSRLPTSITIYYKYYVRVSTHGKMMSLGINGVPVYGYHQPSTHA